MPSKEGEIIVRPFQTDDAPAIVQLTIEEFASVSIDAKIEAMLGGTPWTRIKEKVLRDELATNPGGCFVAAAGGQVVGYVTTVLSPLASRGTIANLVVSSACQGRGIGRKLIQQALDYFRSAGLRQAKIETLGNNEVGQHLYPALGFREVTRQIHYVMPLTCEPETPAPTRGGGCEGSPIK